MESGAPNTEINIIVYSDYLFEGTALLRSLGEMNYETRVNEGTYKGLKVRGYIRGPDVDPVTFDGITHILLIHGLKDTSFEGAKDYLESRKGIPFKYYIDSEDNGFAAKLNIPFLAASAWTDDQAAREKVLEEARHYEENILAAFLKFDLNKNGSISKEELVAVSKELGHELNEVEAGKIAHSLSKEGNISYKNFKKWWVMGKENHGAFRKMVELQIRLEDKLTKTSNVFNEYWKSVSGAQTSSGTGEYHGNVDIGPTVDFEHGLGVAIKLSLGGDADEIVNASPSYFRTNPITVGIEIEADDESKASEVVATLNELQGMAEGVPQVSQALAAGVKYFVRQSGKSVFIDVTVGGFFGDQIGSYARLFDLASVPFKGTKQGSITTGLKLTDLLNDNVESIIDKVSNLKIEAKADIFGLSGLVAGIIQTVVSLNSFNPKFVWLLQMLNLIGTFRKGGFEFKYDAQTLSALIKSQVNSFKEGNNLEMLNALLAGFQEQGKGALETGKGIAGMFLEPYLPALRTINFDKLSIYVNASGVKLHKRVELSLPGLTAFIRQNFFEA
jgi:hypothetical protein